MEESIQAAVAQALQAKGDLKQNTLPNTTTSVCQSAEILEVPVPHQIKPQGVATLPNLQRATSRESGPQRFDMSDETPQKQFPNVPPLSCLPQRENVSINPAAILANRMKEADMTR